VKLLIGRRPELTGASFIESAFDKVSGCCILQFVGEREGMFKMLDNFTAPPCRIDHCHDPPNRNWAL
jgi:hypothetical protein